MFLQSCRPASVLPDNKVAITDQSQEEVIFPLQSRLTLSKDLFTKTPEKNKLELLKEQSWLTHNVVLHISRNFSLSCNPLFSLRSKRFQSSYCAKVRAGAKKKRWKSFLFFALVPTCSTNSRGNDSPPPPLSFLFFFALVPTFSTNSRGNACYAGYPLFQIWIFHH